MLRVTCSILFLAISWLIILREPRPQRIDAHGNVEHHTARVASMLQLKATEGRKTFSVKLDASLQEFQGPEVCAWANGVSAAEAADQVNANGENVKVSVQVRTLHAGGDIGVHLFSALKMAGLSDSIPMHYTVKLVQGENEWYVNPNYGDGNNPAADPPNTTQPAPSSQGYFCVSLDRTWEGTFAAVQKETHVTELLPTNAKRLFLEFLGPLSTVPTSYGWSTFDVVDRRTGNCIICSQVCADSTFWVLYYMEKRLQATLASSKFVRGSGYILIDSYEEVPADSEEAQKFFERYAYYGNQWEEASRGQQFFSIMAGVWKHARLLSEETIFLCDKNEHKCFKFHTVPGNRLLPVPFKSVHVTPHEMVERRACLLQDFFPELSSKCGRREK